MRKVSWKRCGTAAVAVMLAVVVASCGPRPEGPAPVVSGEAAATTAPLSVTVQPGQTLSSIAHAYHVPMQVIAEANRLWPPYRIEAGRTLIIPQTGQPGVSLAAASLAAPSGPKTEDLAATSRPEAILPGRTTPPPAVSPPPAALAPPTSTVSAQPIAPEAPHLEAKTAAAQPAPAATSEPPAATATQPTPAPDSSTFIWPVRGHVVAGYGMGRDGTHNDGINIAAPRGAAVEATGGGVVAYAGNELRGYGNLILVKHPNGWISAYAHCDQILVKRGEKVARGQTIARVGSTGNVAEPQLHFELRHGNHAVDPREFLAPLPTAGSERGSSPS
jgi:murein DD-endopeptidase MepM/ murein hydrolase activator NlpD